jgi:hypothetical protein
MKNLTRDEKTTYVSALREHREQKVSSVRANNIAAARDVLVTTERVIKEVSFSFITCILLDSFSLQSSTICVFAQAPMQLYTLFGATSMTRFKARCMVLIIPKISGRTSMTLQWPMFSVNMSNGHARRIKVSRLAPHYYFILFLSSIFEILTNVTLWKRSESKLEN